MTELEKLKKKKSEITKRIKELELMESTKEIGIVRARVNPRKIGPVIKDDGTFGDKFIYIWQVQIMKNRNEDLNKANRYVTVGNVATKEQLVHYIDNLIADLSNLQEIVNNWDYKEAENATR